MSNRPRPESHQPYPLFTNSLPTNYLMANDLLLARRQPLVMRRPRPGCSASHSNTVHGVQTSHMSNGIVRATLIGAAASVLAQVVGCPIDVVSKLALTGGRTGLLPRLQAATTLVKTAGPSALFNGLPNHLMKRAPTKALTVCLFEVLRQRDGGKPKTKMQHLQTALFAGSVALLATYPLSVLYYARRKAIPAAAVLNRVRTTAGGVLYAGLTPALLAVAPSVAIDYSVYSSTRARLAPAPCAHVQVADARPGAPTPAFAPAQHIPVTAIVVAAALSNVVAGAFAEPLKTVARRSAVAALRGNKAHAPAIVARELLSKGPLEFWNGFRTRSVRYAVTAVVSKTTVQRLREFDAARLAVK